MPHAADPARYSTRAVAGGPLLFSGAPLRGHAADVPPRPRRTRAALPDCAPHARDAVHRPATPPSGSALRVPAIRRPAPPLSRRGRHPPWVPAFFAAAGGAFPALPGPVRDRVDREVPDRSRNALEPEVE